MIDREKLMKDDIEKFLEENSDDLGLNISKVYLAHTVLIDTNKNDNNGVYRLLIQSSINDEKIYILLT